MGLLVVLLVVLVALVGRRLVVDVWWCLVSSSPTPTPTSTPSRALRMLLTGAPYWCDAVGAYRCDSSSLSGNLGPTPSCSSAPALEVLKRVKVTGTCYSKGSTFVSILSRLKVV